MHPSFVLNLRRGFATLLAAAAFFAAGCHNYNYNSGYGNVFVTVTNVPGDFASYIVGVDTITFTRTDGVVVGTTNLPQEQMDLTKVDSISELLANTQIPAGTYTSMTIQLDYSITNFPNVNVSVMVNGRPQQATVVDSTGAAVTQQSVTVNFDPANPLNIVDTFATTAAQRLALDIDLAASTLSVNTATNPVTVVAQPYVTAAIAADDTKLIRVRGPLINTDVNYQTFTVYVRPFNDPVNNIGTVTMFDDANTLVTLDGTDYIGQAGINALSQASAGTTVAASYTTYEPTVTPSATAAIFHTKYVLAGHTLEDIYTAGLDGEVVARNGDTLTLRNATLTLYNGLTYLNQFLNTDSTVVVGPKTLVTADDNTTLANLSAQSIAVGQHIVARGVCTGTCQTAPYNIDATGASTQQSVSSGSVRLLPTSLYGTLTASTNGELTINLASIDGNPASIYNFAGNGTTSASDSNPASYVVSAAGLTLPTTLATGGPVWIDGLTAPFGAAPPDFLAYDVNAEAAVPASLRVRWSAATNAPFSALSANGVTVDLANPALASAVLRIGAASIDLHSLPASPQIVPQTAAPAQSGLPTVFAPRFSVGNGVISTIQGQTVSSFSSFATYAQTLTTDFATGGAVFFDAQGLYDPSTNTFSASSVNVLL